jgi:hypothetical protein
LAAGLGIMEVCSSNDMGAPNASHLEQETTQPNRPKQTKISPGKRADSQETEKWLTLLLRLEGGRRDGTHSEIEAEAGS